MSEEVAAAGAVETAPGPQEEQAEAPPSKVGADLISTVPLYLFCRCPRPVWT